jgi:hypothetical protein
MISLHLGEGFMKKRGFRAHSRVRIAMPVLAAIVLAGVCALPWSDSRAQATLPSVHFHVISAGGHALRNSCFLLSGTAGQAAPGYSSGLTESIVAGFWAGAPTTGLDEIFFNGFEDC